MVVRMEFSNENDPFAFPPKVTVPNYNYAVSKGRLEARRMKVSDYHNTATLLAVIGIGPRPERFHFCLLSDKTCPD